MKFRIIVNGQPADVTAKSKHALHSVIPPALDQTGNSGQPPENWELRDVTGTLLDTTKAISAFGFGEGARLYLNLKAGIGGSEQACAGHVCLDADDGTGHQVITLGCARADAHRMHYDEDRGLWWAGVDEMDGDPAAAVPEQAAAPAPSLTIKVDGTLTEEAAAQIREQVRVQRGRRSDLVRG